MERSGSTRTRPARSRATPSDFASGDADPGRPDDGARAKGLGAEGHAVGGNAGHRASGAHLDAAGAQLLFRARRALRRIGREDARRSLDEHDPGLARVDRAEVADEDVAGDFGDRPGQLDARRSAAHDHEGEQLLALDGIGLTLGLLEREQDAAPDRERVFERLQAGGVLFPFVVAEVRMAGARREDQVVVGEGPVGEDDLPSRGVDRRDVRE